MLRSGTNQPLFRSPPTRHRTPMSHPSIGPGVEQADLSAISPRQGPSAPPSVLASSRAVCMFVCVCGGVACAYACCVSSYYINPSSTAWQLCYDAVDIRCDLMRSSCVYGVSVQSDDTARARGGASDPTRHDGDPKRHARKHAAPTPHSTSPHRRFFSPARSGRDFLAKPHSRTVDT